MDKSMETVEECLKRHGLSKDSEIEIYIRIRFIRRTFTYEQVQKIYKHCKTYYWFWKIEDNYIFNCIPKEIEVTLLPKDILDIVLNYIRPLTYLKTIRKAVDVIPHLRCPVNFSPDNVTSIKYTISKLKNAKDMVQELINYSLHSRDFRVQNCVTLKAIQRIREPFFTGKKPLTKKRKIEQS